MDANTSYLCTPRSRASWSCPQPLATRGWSPQPSPAPGRRWGSGEASLWPVEMMLGQESRDSDKCACGPEAEDEDNGGDEDSSSQQTSEQLQDPDAGARVTLDTRTGHPGLSTHHTLHRNSREHRALSLP